MIGFFHRLKLKVLNLLDRFSDYDHRMKMGMHSLDKGRVEPYLFVGGQYNLRGLIKLKKMGITAIINMRIHSPLSEIHFKGIKYLHLPTKDHTAPSLEDLIEGVNFADEEIKHGGKVFIHCRQGIERGPTMTIAYLLKKGFSFEDAFNKVQMARSFIRPTYVQVLRLRELEKYFKEGGD
jgi:dual specificity MAP kinase phosphatase